MVGLGIGQVQDSVLLNILQDKYIFSCPINVMNC